MDQGAEPVPAQNPDVHALSRWLRVPDRWSQMQRSVRPVKIVMSR
jgi:hypothetical protein